MRKDCEVWNEVLVKDEASLTDPERTILLLNRLLGDLENGGLSGFLYDVSPDAPGAWSDGWIDLRRTADALERAGGAPFATLLRRMAEALESVDRTDEDDGKGDDWGDFLDRVEPEGLLDDIERQLDVGALWQCVSDFTTDQLQTERR